MESFKKTLSLFWVIAVFIFIPLASFASHPGHNACNPCAKNACNPCAKNACNPCGRNACNPCAKNACNPCGKRMKNACNPCNPCNPCASKPPKPIRDKHITNYSKLVDMGEKLWKKVELGNSGLSCWDCHEDYENFDQDTVGPFPHFVNMPNDIVTLDQMINFCMINPMESQKLDSSSIEMTAMSAFYQKFIKGYVPFVAPKNACNPCGKKKMRNTCNPCGKKMKNACNPCNPCGSM